MRNFALIITLAISTLNIDMYQDRTDKNKTVIIIENDGVINTYTVNNSDLNDKLVEKLVRRYEISK